MGGETFMTRARGRTAREAFDRARDRAAYEHGHGGYTGTIAEKQSFVMISIPESFPSTLQMYAPGRPTPQREEAFAQYLIEEDDPRISDKWGDAGCIECRFEEFLFFGWASA